MEEIIVLKSEAKRWDTGYYYKIKRMGSLFHEGCLSRLLHFVIQCFGEIKHLLHLHLYFSTKSTGARVHFVLFRMFVSLFHFRWTGISKGHLHNGHFPCFTIYSFLMSFLVHNLSSPSTNTNKNLNWSINLDLGVQGFQSWNLKVKERSPTKSGGYQ